MATKTAKTKTKTARTTLDPIAPSPHLGIVKLVNVSESRSWTLRHDIHAPGDGLTLEPGETLMAPLNLALVCFGNPGARNEGTNRLRDIEIAHVHLYWGYAKGIYPEGEWEEKFCPEIEVYDLEGNRIWMIHDDPDGSEASAEHISAIDEATDPQTLMRQIRELQEAQLAQARAASTDDSQAQAEHNRLRDEIPEADEDTGPTVDRARAPRTGTRSRTKS